MTLGGDASVVSWSKDSIYVSWKFNTADHTARGVNQTEPRGYTIRYQAVGSQVPTNWLAAWRSGRGVVVGGVRRMNEVNARRARLRAGIPSRYVTSQLGQLSLASLRGRLTEYQLRLR